MSNAPSAFTITFGVSAVIAAGTYRTARRLRIITMHLKTNSPSSPPVFVVNNIFNGVRVLPNGSVVVSFGEFSIFNVGYG